MRFASDVEVPSLTVNGNPAWHSGNLFLVGLVAKFASDSEPPGWLMCDGSEVSRSNYSGLFSVIGTSYGDGDGSTTFNLPNFLPYRVLVDDSGEPYTYNGDLITFNADSEIITDDSGNPYTFDGETLVFGGILSDSDLMPFIKF